MKKGRSKRKEERYKKVGFSQQHVMRNQAGFSLCFDSVVRSSVCFCLFVYFLLTWSGWNTQTNQVKQPISLFFQHHQHWSTAVIIRLFCVSRAERAGALVWCCFLFVNKTTCRVFGCLFHKLSPQRQEKEEKTSRKLY